MKDYSSIRVSRKMNGECRINTDLVVSNWGILWSIIQWGDSFHLVKHRRKDSVLTDVKMPIVPEHARALIDRLRLKGEVSESHSRCTTWRGSGRAAKREIAEAVAE